MLRRSIQALLIAFFILIQTGTKDSSLIAQEADLRAGFRTPPTQAGVRCYWWWLNGNTDLNTITKDLEAMKSKGIHGAILVDADGSGEQGNREVKEGPAIGTEPWIKLFTHALQEADRLGIEISLNVTSRMNVGIIGGPSVQPQDALKRITWSRVTVSGGQKLSLDLPTPPSANGFYQPICVLAYPLHHGAALAGSRESHRAAIPDLPFKSATREPGFSMPRPEETLRSIPSTPGDQDADPSEIIDLSAMTTAGGHLSWLFPSGTWEVLRLGYTDTAMTLTSAAQSEHGLAVDVLSTQALDHYWQNAVLPLLSAAKPWIGSSLRYLVTDSWEAGGVNWTDNFRAEFQKRRGYDPAPWLPVVTGRILGSRTESDRFLADLRRTVADLITENYYDHFAQLAQQNGLQTHPESGGPHGAPVDALETFRSAAFPQTEFWANSGWHRTRDHERFFVKEASSAAHIYGKTFVAAEGPTSMSRAAWSEALGTNLQPAIDRAFTEGMNRIFWHEFTSSPAEYGKPGQEYFAGTHLNPNVTWWQQSAPFLLSIQRAQFLLQHGQPVVDLLYYYGNQIPAFVRVKNDDPAHLQNGHDYDVINEDALLHRMQYEGSSLHTPEGIQYRALALPSNSGLTPAVLRWVEEFMRQGGVVIGSRPGNPSGRLLDNHSDEYNRLVDQIWKQCTSSNPLAHYGKGLLYCSADANMAMRHLGILPDFQYTPATADVTPHKDSALDYVHRTTTKNEIYFLRNTRNTEQKANLIFRVKDMTPEIWSVRDGSETPVAIYHQTNDGRTQIPLSFPAYGSAFIVFHPADKVHLTQAQLNQNDLYPSVVSGAGVFTDLSGNLISTTAGDFNFTDSNHIAHSYSVAEPPAQCASISDWSLDFPINGGAPKSVAVKTFRSWTEWSDPDIKYFSGTALYHATLGLKTLDTNQQLWLQLGELREIATVRVNGVDAATLWQSPNAVRLDPFLHSGMNTLEIQVSDLWPNRLIGDLQSGARHPLTHTNIQAYTKESPLLPSGILNPVTLLCARRVAP